MELFDSVHRPLFLTQWKAYSPIQKIKDFIEVLAAHPNFEGKHYLLALPQTHLKELSACKLPPEVILGAKSIESVKEGTFTDSIATIILKKVGANFVLVGNHESRQVLKESDESINKKIHRLLEEKLQPVLCIGETLKDAQPGNNVDLLTDQLRNGLEGLNDKQKEQLIIFYEAPWLQATPKKLTLDDTIKAYEACRKAMRQAIGDDFSNKMRVIYALPEESIDLNNLIVQTSGTSFYSAMPDNILPLLGLIDTSAPKVSEHVEGVLKPKIFTKVSPAEEEMEHADHLLQVECAKKYLVMPAEKKSIEEKEVVKKVDVENVLTENNKVETEEIEEGTVSKPRKDTSIKQQEETEEMLLPVRESAPDLQADKTVFAQLPNQILPLSEKEKVVELAREEKAKIPLEKASDQNEQIHEETKRLPAEFSIGDLKLKSDALNRDQIELASSYASMQEQGLRLTQLRKDYPSVYEKATHALNLLDIDLQARISQRDDEFFQANPEKLEAARPAFEWIDQLNEIVNAAEVIPKKVDRQQIKAKQLREKLQGAWDYLNSHRKQIMKAHPDFDFPSQPKALQSPAPNVDLSFPALEGASPLVQRNIGTVPIKQAILSPKEPEAVEESMHARPPEKATAFPSPNTEIVEVQAPSDDDKLAQQSSKVESSMDIQLKGEELKERADSLLKADEALRECYKKIKDLSERLPYLRTQFPDLLSKMTADLNQLDPFLQQKINTGNVSYFSENPDKAKEASVVLVQLQNLSQLFQETAAIPRDVDRLLSKGRELRKNLETEWTYFRTNKRKIKEKFPDFSFPAHPSQLLISEPVVDLTPKDSPPATLGAKRFAVVKAPPLKK